MRNHISISLLLLCFSLTVVSNNVKAQKGVIQLDCDSLISEDDLYSILNYIIEYRNLDKSYYLNTSPLQNLSRDIEDRKFLKSLVKDSTRKFYEDKIDDSGKVIRLYSEPNLNILESSDLKFIKCQKRNFNLLKWDNSKLGFSENYQKGSVSFSIPYFNMQKNIVILRYEYYCGVLCAGGQTITLYKNGNNWEIKWLESWIS